jgi:hypothetical protein
MLSFTGFPFVCHVFTVRFTVHDGKYVSHTTALKFKLSNQEELSTVTCAPCFVYDLECIWRSLKAKPKLHVCYILPISIPETGTVAVGDDQNPPIFRQLQTAGDSPKFQFLNLCPTDRIPHSKNRQIWTLINGAVGSFQYGFPCIKTR